MEEKELRKIANNNGLSDAGLFVKFMMKRFPDEAYEGYIIEWVQRFITGNPISYMDAHSKRCYLAAVDEV